MRGGGGRAGGETRCAESFCPNARAGVFRESRICNSGKRGAAHEGLERLRTLPQAAELR